MWAGIKHALNSTLGTSGFKPLNTLITDYVDTSKTAIIDTIVGHKSLGPSDSVYAVISADGSTGSDSNSFVKKFKANTNGNIRILASGYCMSSGTYADLDIAINGQYLYTMTYYSSGSNNPTYLDIPIQKNDVVSFNRDRYLSLDYLKIGAVVVDGTLGEVV